MGNSLRLKTLASAVSIALIGGAAAMPMHNAIAADTDKVADTSASTEIKAYFIRFSEAGLMHYTGGVAGLASTARVGERGKIDVKSANSVAYLDFLARQRTQHVNAINAALGRSIGITHSYAITMNGVAADLTLDEAVRVSRMPGVQSVRIARDERLETFRGPEFIGADAVWNGTGVPGGVGTRGQGVVVGVIDSGAFATHPSFADDAACGFGASNHKLLSTVDCSTSAGGLCNGPNPEANDGNGHGVHTASTAAGNTLDTTAVPPPTIPAPYTHMSGVAPCASVRTYKVCETNTCSGSAIVAGIENAITDGVDVINYSISGGSDPWNDGDRMFLDAVGADIFVAASAGNTRAATPDPVGEVNHLGPWMLTVAASTHDNNVAGSGSLSVTGPGTPPAGTTGLEATSSSSPNLGTALTNAPIRINPANAVGCTATGGFPANHFTGAIALIPRGSCSFEEKVNNAAGAGALVAIIYNNAAGALNMNVGGATLPAYSILQTEGTAISNFITANGATTTTADFNPAVKQGDVLAGFSLRGPSALTSVTKPDITGPGVNIYAAVTATEGNYGYYSGTSMSSPHLAGSAALLRAARPDWTPAEVKSAIMLTAFNGGHKEDLVTAWDPDDVGSGRVDLTRAAKTGLVMNETYDNVLAADPASAGDPATLNIPSMRNMNCVETCSWTRTVKGALAGGLDADVIFVDGFDGPQPPALLETHWTASATGATGLTLTVSPSTFTINNANPTQELTITADLSANLTNVTFGEVVLHETGGLAPDAHMFASVKGTGPVVDPDIVDSGQLDLSVPSTFDGMYINWLTFATCTTGCTGTNFDFNAYNGGSALQFFWPGNGGGEGGVASAGVYSVLLSGATIDASSTILASTSSAATANFRAGVTHGYLGFKVTCPAGACYGYADVSTTAPSGFPMTVHRWWYNSAGAAITIP